MTNTGKTTPSDANINELERLREILYGQQARSTDERFKDLAIRQETIRQELTEQINLLGAQLSSRLEALAAELKERLEKQDGSQQQIAEANKQAFAHQLDLLQADSSTQLAALKQSLETSHADLASQIQSALNVSEQSAAALEDKKISRQAFGQLLAELGERLQKQIV